MLQSQKRQVRQFLSSGEIDNEPHCGINNRVSMKLCPGTRGNALAPPSLDYNALTASAPAEQYSTCSKENHLTSGGIVDTGRISQLSLN